MGYSGWRHAHHVDCGMHWLASFCPLVTSMQLCPTFLKKTHPQLITFALCETTPAFFCREIIINYDGGFNSIYPEFKQIDTSFIYFLVDKTLLNSFRELCHRRKSAQKVAITQLSLGNVIWRDFIFKDFRILENFCSSLPLHPFKFTFALRIVWFAQGRHLGWKIFVSKWLAYRNYLVNHNFSSLEC